jgi:short subunit dehydrogenase-like uncharacterized protein
MNMTDPKYSVIVFGATSFVGRILCRYLVEQFGVSGNLKWAAAARSETRLRALRDSMGSKAAELPLIVADAASEKSLADLCAQTRVVISTVGPYALHGEPLVKVCAESGTDYCDLTGEVQWIRRMIARYESAAQRSGARIVNCCGFDSIPSDLGVFFLQQKAMERFGQACTRIKMRVKALAGSVSGGTVASIINVVREAANDPALRRELSDPYSICPANHGFSARQAELKTAQYDQDFKTWIAPFVMAGINTRVVHRTNALSKHAYGSDFTYDEAIMTKGGPTGWLVAQAGAIGIMGFLLATALPPSRWLLERFVVPKPGEGPSPAAQERGFYDLRFLGTTAGGKSVRVKITGDRDPGYGSTAKMLGQAGACLALDIAKSDWPGGFWTPATVFGERLIERLTADAGLTFSVLDA